MERYNINPDDIADTGFIVNGKYEVKTSGEPDSIRPKEEHEMRKKEQEAELKLLVEALKKMSKE